MAETPEESKPRSEDEDSIIQSPLLNPTVERILTTERSFDRSGTPPLNPIMEETERRPSLANPAIENLRASERSIERATPPGILRTAASGSGSPPPAPTPGISRSGTVPLQPKRTTSGASNRSQDRGRRRGKSISVNELRQETTPQPPSGLGRWSSLRTKPSREDDHMMAIPESRAASPLARVPTSTSQFVSPGMRRRTSTMRTSANNTGLNRRGTASSNSRPVLNVGHSTGSAVPGDNQSGNFTLAGTSPAVMETVAANQPYVDPGYSQLNPAYENPVNARPVWGLARPLPRVIRPGMVPTRSELRIDTGVAGDSQKPVPPANVDLEQGIQPTLRLGNVTSQLDDVRRQREANLLQGYGFISPIRTGTRQSQQDEVIPFPDINDVGDEDDLGLARPVDSHLPTEEQPGEPRTDWDNTSAVTEKPEDEDLDGDWIGEEVPLAAFEPSDEEIHNLHTHWSVIRVRFREPLAELLAVTVQLTLGFCADLVNATSTAPTGTNTNWAWGLASMVGIYIAGGISGAHLNPAVSIMLWIYRGFPLRKVGVYVIAQILGAFLAALIAFGIYQKDIIEAVGADLAAGGTLSSFVTFPRFTWIDAGTAFFTEFVATAILAIAVLALGDDANAPPGAGMSAFIMGLVIVVLGMAFSHNTGAAMNPSRDFGPRLAVMALGYGTDVFTTAYWLWGPWCATISGAVFGGFLYDAAIFVGGESPVNYPRKRIQRAGRKWKKRMGSRIKKRLPGKRTK